jgi:hypothetical protein
MIEAAQYTKQYFFHFSCLFTVYLPESSQVSSVNCRHWINLNLTRTECRCISTGSKSHLERVWSYVTMFFFLNYIKIIYFLIFKNNLWHQHKWYKNKKNRYTLSLPQPTFTHVASKLIHPNRRLLSIVKGRKKHLNCHNIYIYIGQYPLHFHATLPKNESSA